MAAEDQVKRKGFTEQERTEIARILEIVAKDGLNQPRDLDGALDAIECTIDWETR